MTTNVTSNINDMFKALEIQNRVRERMTPIRFIESCLNVPVLYWDGTQDEFTFLRREGNLIEWKDAKGEVSTDNLAYIREILDNSLHLWVRSSVYVWHDQNTFGKKIYPKITSCRITAYPKKLGDPMPEVWATFSDGAEKRLFSFYPDEINFGADEFIGLTEEEARNLFSRRDTAYLRS